MKTIEDHMAQLPKYGKLTPRGTFHDRHTGERAETIEASTDLIRKKLCRCMKIKLKIQRVKAQMTPLQKQLDGLEKQLDGLEKQLDDEGVDCNVFLNGQ
jgi:seryl-tRNA synthetase